MNIENTKLYVKYPPKIYTIDYGRCKRQGKRIGKMVVGGMGDSLMNKKNYIDLLGNVPEKELFPDDFRGITQLDKINYLKAREYGLNHMEALKYMDSKHI